MPVAKKYFEIRWHGRAGQGAKSASQMLAEAALEAGKYVQAFPEYGAERTGAPMRAFNRIGDEYIRVRSAVENPDVVVVIDETLLSPAIVEGLSEDGILLVNTVKDFEFVRKKTGFNGKICVVDATDIALQEIKERNTEHTDAWSAGQSDRYCASRGDREENREDVRKEIPSGSD